MNFLSKRVKEYTDTKLMSGFDSEICVLFNIPSKGSLKTKFPQETIETSESEFQDEGVSVETLGLISIFGKHGSNSFMLQLSSVAETPSIMQTLL